MEKIKLLVVDDEEAFLKALTRRLEMRDFAVTKALNADEALGIARMEKFDIALVDLRMPGMDGDELIEILKREHEFIEVIMLTGHGSVESAVGCIKVGAFGYLPKPYEMDKLVETLRSAYESRMRKKFAADEARMKMIERAAIGQSPLGILRSLRALDSEAG